MKLKMQRVSLGEIPTSYLKSMTYAEMLTWMCKYLDENVGAKLNEMIEQINDLDDGYTELKNYIDSEILELKNYVDGLIGDINEALDLINGEVV